MKKLIYTGLALASLNLSAQSDNLVPSVTTISIGQKIGDGIAVDSNGSIFIASGNGNEFVWKVTPEGQFTEFASGLTYAVGVAIDNHDNVYVNAYGGNTMYQITPEGLKSEFATDLNGPAGIAIDSQSFLYVTEFGADFSGNGARITKIAPDGAKSTFASGAPLNDVIGIAIDEADNVYVTNWSSSIVYKIPSGSNTPEEFATLPVTTSINQITYANGYLYIPANTTNEIYRIDLDGKVSLFAGTGLQGSSDGPVLEATFNDPNSIAANPAGDLIYVIDNQSKRLRKIEIPTYLGFEQIYIDSTLHINSGNWLGWLEIGKAPWLFLYTLDTYAYINESSVNAQGGWIYISK